MKLGENQTTYIFDPAKVTAVAVTYSLSVTLKPVRGDSGVNRGPLTAHVWGIAEIPLSIELRAAHKSEQHKIYNRTTTSD
jgi:hypothetical protein